MTDTAKYNVIKKGNTKVGIAIIDKVGGPYVSAVGHAKLLYKNNIEFGTLYKNILANYFNEEEAEEQLKIRIKEDWVLLELEPEKIISVNQRGGL